MGLFLEILATIGWLLLAIMILATDGVLEYDDPITKYLPELDRFQQSPTIRQLLNHTGGLPDYYDTLEEATGDVWPTTEEAHNRDRGYRYGDFHSGASGQSRDYSGHLVDHPDQ